MHITPERIDLQVFFIPCDIAISSSCGENFHFLPPSCLDLSSSLSAPLLSIRILLASSFIKRKDELWPNAEQKKFNSEHGQDVRENSVYRQKQVVFSARPRLLLKTEPRRARLTDPLKVHGTDRRTILLNYGIAKWRQFTETPFEVQYQTIALGKTRF